MINHSNISKKAEAEKKEHETRNRKPAFIFFEFLFFTASVITTMLVIGLYGNGTGFQNVILLFFGALAASTASMMVLIFWPFIFAKIFGSEKWWRIISARL